MSNIHDVGIQIIQLFQGLGDWIIPIMKAFTFLADEQFYLLVAPLLYWCIDTTIGIRIAMMLMFSTSIHNYLKWLIHSPRPSWYSTEVKAYRFEPSFGTPSGHATNAVTIWGILGDSYRKNWLWAIVITVIVLIGLSRIVLAIHFPHDVLLGWITGTLVLIAFIKAESSVKAWLERKTVKYQFALFFGISIVIILISVLILIPIRDWTVPTMWIENAKLAYPDEEINPKSLSGGITLAGTFFGLAVGHKLTFSGNGFSPRGTSWKLFFRYILGVLGVFLIWYGLDIIFPDGDSVVAYLFRYIRYGLIGFWITFMAPCLFITLNLAKSLKS